MTIVKDVTIDRFSCWFHAERRGRRRRRMKRRRWIGDRDGGRRRWQGWGDEIHGRKGHLTWGKGRAEGLKWR